MTKKKFYTKLSEASDAARQLGFKTKAEYKARYKQDPRLPCRPDKYYNKFEDFRAFLGTTKEAKYLTYAEAMVAARQFGFKTVSEYKAGYKQDPRLPCSPDSYYDDFEGFRAFLGTEKADIYPTYAEASEAACKLRLKTKAEYKAGYKQDPRLPCQPNKCYDDFERFRAFLGTEKEDKYPTYAEARIATRKFGFKTYAKYKAGYKQDPRLPCEPEEYYDNFKGYPAFLGTEKRSKYPTYAEASVAARKLGFKTVSEYKAGYKQDPRLPCSPDSYYDDFEGFRAFLGTEKADIYPTYAEACEAARKLGFKTSAEYKSNYKQDPRLPYSPERCYDNFEGFRGFLGTTKVVKYPTYVEASAAARKLSLKTMSEYKVGYKQDPRLPYQPNKCYDDFKGFPAFLGTEKEGNYPTYAKARAAARKLGFKTCTEYKSNYKQDPRLPCSPDSYYDDFEGFRAFLGTEKAEIYPTYAEARAAARKFGFLTAAEYVRNYNEDPRLPCKPEKTYDNFEGYRAFLGTEKEGKYPTCAEASAAARKIGFKTWAEYRAGYRQDPKLPSTPNQRYDDFKGIAEFLGITKITKYSKCAEASAAACKLGLKSILEYQAGYKQDPRLPGSPDQYYDDFDGFPDFLGTRKAAKYTTSSEASAAARKLGFKTKVEFVAGYKQDPQLTSEPHIFYENVTGWTDFILPKKYNNLRDVKFALKVLNIKNSKEYRNLYKNFPPLPAHPERVFKAEWVDWFDLCDIPRPYSYEEAIMEIAPLKLKNKESYKAYLRESDNARLPYAPDECYEKDWRNWYVYLGKPEPFRLKYIYEPYLAWKVEIQGFMKMARGGGAKETHLCRFVRLYIQPRELGHSPESFLTRKVHDVFAFNNLLLQENLVSNPRGFFQAVTEFLEHFLANKLIIEDENTGELISLNGARNPFTGVKVGSIQNTRMAETCKPALAYQYVEAVKDWITPPSASTFSDLKHLQKFNGDWVEIHPDSIDETDPDCIIKVERGKTKIWLPIYWVHTLALVSVPARGKQLAYNDSGEADKEVPVITTDKKIEWVANDSLIAGQTDRQGFIKKYPNSQLGMHFTTNKTSNHGRGYDVAWIPDNLAYWLIRLRMWQQKYNPIHTATSWLDCTRTDLNEVQLKAKGVNSFLFRDFSKKEPGYFSDRLSKRLAAALYFSQPKTLELAEHNGCFASLSLYDSQYKPHSMRVSLITAYVMEFGLPIEIIMKVAGHSSIVMSIYYLKTNSEALRQRFGEGEKRALRKKGYATQSMIEQGRIDEIQHELITNSSGKLESLLGTTPAGNYLFRDYGFCPYAGSRCNDGGNIIGYTSVRSPVPNGYLGGQNCIRCRHFVTGPAFLGGLLSLSNEILLYANNQYKHYAELKTQSEQIKQKISRLDEMEYEAVKSGETFNDGDRNSLEVELRKCHSESEAAAMKLDVLMCEIQAISYFINQCKSLVNKQIKEPSAAGSTDLIVAAGNELDLAIEESSPFRQLSEVCENALIYESASADLAISPRSQMIDKMMLFNGLEPILFTLDKKQQLVIGNQLSNLLMSRLKTWERLDAVIDGRLYLRDLIDSEQITQADFDLLIGPELKKIKLEKIREKL